MSGHYIAWTIDDFGVTANVTCHEDAGALCRFGCHDCEEPYAICDGRNCDGHDPGRHCEYGHRFRPFDVCTIVEWFDNTTAYELYGGPANHPIRDGLIEIVWDYDDMTWHYPETDPAQLAVTP